MQALSARGSTRRVGGGAAARAGAVSRRPAVVVQAKKTPDGPSLAIVGVTGAVGQEFLQVCPPRSARRLRGG